MDTTKDYRECTANKCTSHVRLCGTSPVLPSACNSESATTVTRHNTVCQHTLLQSYCRPHQNLSTNRSLPMHLFRNRNASFTTATATYLASIVNTCTHHTFPGSGIQQLMHACTHLSFLCRCLLLELGFRCQTLHALYHEGRSTQKVLNMLFLFKRKEEQGPILCNHL